MRRAGVAALGALVLLAAGCGGDEAPTPSVEAAPWLGDADPVDPTGLVWASGTTVHLADGTEVELDAEPVAYVVAGGGVYYERDGSAEVQYAGADGTTTSTELSLQPGTLAASPDGRFVGGIDRRVGERDDYGTPLATVRVFDLEAGDEVLTTSEGMGDTGSDDLSVLYENVDLGLRLTDGTAYVDDAEGGWHEHDLGTGEPDPAEPDWAVTARPGLHDVLTGPDGQQVVPRTGTGRWLLDAWLDDRTVVGIAVDGAGGGARVGPRDTTTLMTCVVPSGRCTLVPATTGLDVSFPATLGIAGMVLQEGES